MIKAFTASLLKNSNECSEEKFPLCLGLDSVKDPGNLGTIIRLADWYGINAIFASEDTVELYNPKTVQATMGAIFRTTAIYSNLAETAKEFQNGRFAGVRNLSGWNGHLGKQLQSKQLQQLN
jgi:TrmH family RNA methyltransferase